MGRKIPVISAVIQGLNIVWYRSLNDWSQEDLESKSGVSQQDISKYEKLNKIPDDILEKFATAFGVNIRYLKDVASYAAAQNTYVYGNEQAIVKACDVIREQKITYPLDTLKQSYDENIARIIEAHTNTANTLQAQIEDLKKDKADLKEELLELRGKK